MRTKSKPKTFVNGAGISRTPDCCGGETRIANTRITVRHVVAYRAMGLPNAQILLAFPHLTQKNLDDAFSYAHKRKFKNHQLCT